MTGPIERARDVATEILTTCWDPSRFCLDVDPTATRFRFDRALGDHVRVMVRVRERLGWVRALALPDGGASAGFPVPPPALSVPAQASRALRALAIQAARRQFPAAELSVGAVRAEGRTRWIEVFSRQPDGWVQVDLDPVTAEPLGTVCAPFLRGSRRAAALSRKTALVHACAALPAWAVQATLRRARLKTTRVGRMWRVTFQEGRRTWTVLLHARSGRVVGWLTGRVRERRLSPRSAAERRIAAVAREQLGEGATVCGGLVEGVVSDEQGRPCPGWLSAVRTKSGRVLRASLAEGRVALVDPKRSARLRRR